jgi:hypothetical protein
MIQYLLGDESNLIEASRTSYRQANESDGLAMTALTAIKVNARCRRLDALRALPPGTISSKIVWWRTTANGVPQWRYDALG